MIHTVDNITLYWYYSSIYSNEEIRYKIYTNDDICVLGVPDFQSCVSVTFIVCCYWRRGCADKNESDSFKYSPILIAI
jgi:hypothetical protein